VWINDIEKLEYNGTGKVAENSVQDIFLGLGFAEANIDTASKGWKNKTCYFNDLFIGEVEMAENSFYSQPLGSQKSPDFILNTGGETYFIEVKASKTRSGFQFNTHLVRDEFTYVLSDPTIGFKVVSGSEIMAPEVREILAECHKEQRFTMDRYNKKIQALECNTQGWSYYARPMFSQKRLFA